MKKSFVSSSLPLLMLLAFLILSPVLAISQTGPGGPGNGGGPPTGDAVPFDDHMNLVFLVVGVAFAAFVTIKQLRKRVTATK